jgi:peptidoglycan hydrolase CwlO-like protein
LRSSQKGLNATISTLEKKYEQSKAEYKQLQAEIKTGDNRLKDKENEEIVLRR